jgi:predicted acyl esterase
MDKLVTANRFLPGHRLRIIITPQFYPLFSINPQTGRLEFDSDSVRAGNIRIAHSATEVSRIILPVVSRDPHPERSEGPTSLVPGLP